MSGCSHEKMSVAKLPCCQCQWYKIKKKIIIIKKKKASYNFIKQVFFFFLKKKVRLKKKKQFGGQHIIRSTKDTLHCPKAMANTF